MSDHNEQENRSKTLESEFEFLSENELTEKHWQILEAAVRVFSEKGFSASRTSEVAKEAGVSEGTVFNYFKTKKDLLVGMLIPLMVRFFRPLILSGLERIFKTRKTRSIEDVLQDVVYDRMHLVKKNLPLIKTIAAEAAFHPELIDPLREKVAPKLIETVSQYFQAEVANGTFRELDAKLMIRTLASMIGGYILTRNVMPGVFNGEDEEEDIRQLIDVFLHGVKKQAN